MIYEKPRKADDDEWEAVGGMIGRGKPKYSKKNTPQCLFAHHKSHMTFLELEP
jgi:hypothetical protein